MHFLQALIVATALATACVPIPHFKNATPLMEGTVRRSGAPVRNIPVRAVAGASDNAPCEARHIETTTDSTGYFVLKPIRDRRLSVFILPADAYFEWHLCVQEGESWRVVNRSRDLTLADSGPWWISEIECDLLSLQPCAEERNTNYTQEEVRKLFEKAK